ncbi:WD40 repeat-like protein [Aulographum hederae CBS 113979]|uniref:WD40 repeat-like protein n=1 Tax=Aulographum hederae CBS 113979 TaxID=1176131 RepID=A0A6G1GKU2_9PEZI|nr:WD40 repeat-like protein [Aulographum hederae CBS 113979]
MKLSNPSNVPVYTISGSSTARPLPEWLARKRKRSLKQDPEYANRIELLQDFEFEEASACVRISEDGDWVMSTGTYKPQIHTHYLPNLSLSYARHTNTINQTFILLSSDYSKSLHLQTDRFLEFHTPGGLHYSTRIPRYGRDLLYDKRSAEALIPTVGVNADGSGEVYRLNLELGRFMKAYEVDVGGDDFASTGGGTLQGGINTGSVNSAAVAENTHNLLAFGTSIGTVEFWDPRSRSRVGILSSPQEQLSSESRPEITALQFRKRDGLTIATGSSNGLMYLYDLRSPVPLLKKDQGYGYPIQDLIFLDSSSSTRAQSTKPKILSSDKRIIKIWDQQNGTPWTSVEPAVDLNHVEWCPDSGMLLTANEGRQQHSFFIPQLGPAPKWCAFLDNLVEEMAEDPNDPNAFGGSKTGEVYDNYKFLTMAQLREINLDQMVGKTGVMRPYMHGYFVPQGLYEEAKFISNPEKWQEQRQKSIKEKIDKERESRIRGNKKVTVKVNRKLAEKLAQREEKNERLKARWLLKNGGDAEMLDKPTERSQEQEDEYEEKAKKQPQTGVLSDSRFNKLFQDEEFEIDESSREFKNLNPSAAHAQGNTTKLPKGLTAAEQEALDAELEQNSSESEDDDDDDDAADVDDIAPSKSRAQERYAKNGRPNKFQPSKQKQMMMKASSSNTAAQPKRDQSFGSRASQLKDRKSSSGVRTGALVGEMEITFASAKRERPGAEKQDQNQQASRDRRKEKKDRRSASNNTFRRM